MKSSINIKYFHPEFQIGLEDIRNAWMIVKDKPPVQLKNDYSPGTVIFSLTCFRKTYQLSFPKKRIYKKTNYYRNPIAPASVLKGLCLLK